MNDGIVGIGFDRGFVPANRFGRVTVIEGQITEVHHCRRVSGVDPQRRFEIGARFLTAPRMDVPDASFVERVRVRGLEVGRRLRARFESEAAKEMEHGQSLMFTIDVVTLFPEVFAPFVGLSIVGRAVEAGIVEVRYHHLLDALTGPERADDTPYGGGAGMVLRIEPIARVIDEILASAPEGERRAIVVPSPAGRVFKQSDAERFAALDRLIIVCGHYEGIDERIAELYPAEEFSLGDFVLTGGELPALAFMDATVRLLEGAIASESAAAESFAGGLLDYPSYTRPPVFRGVAVPEVLLSGNHAKIAEWRRAQSRARTEQRRRDLLGPPREAGGAEPEA